MAKPSIGKSLSKIEMRRKYTTGNWEQKRGYLNEEYFAEKEWNPSGPHSTYKSRYVNSFDDSGAFLSEKGLVLSLKEWFRSDGTSEVLPLQIVEETDDAVYVYTPTIGEA